MSKTPDNRPYFEVRSMVSMTAPGHNQQCWQIVSIAGGDVVARGIPSADLAEAMRKGAEEARK